MQLQESRGFKKKIRRLEESSKKLALELELERGRLAGLGQSSASLREHNSVLESALARREADLVQLNLQVPAPASRASGLCRSRLLATGASGLCLRGSSPETAEPLCPSPAPGEADGTFPV